VGVRREDKSAKSAWLRQLHQPDRSTQFVYRKNLGKKTCFIAALSTAKDVACIRRCCPGRHNARITDFLTEHHYSGVTDCAMTMQLFARYLQQAMLARGNQKQA